MWYTYILLCDQKTYYIGIAHDLEQRIREHQRRDSFFTKRFSDIKLVYFELYPHRSNAEKREKQLKGWSSAKKRTLVGGNLKLLKKLSKSSEFADAGQ